MTKLRKIWTLVLTVVMCCALFALPVSAASKTKNLRVFTSDGYSYINSTVTLTASNDSGTKGTIKFNSNATFMGYDGCNVTIPAGAKYSYKADSFKDGSTITLTLVESSVSSSKLSNLKYYYCVKLTGKVHTSGNSFSKLEKIDSFTVPLATARWNGVTQKVGFYFKN